MNGQLELRIRRIQFIALLPTDGQRLFQCTFQEGLFLVTGFKAKGMNIHGSGFRLIGQIIVRLQRIQLRQLRQPMGQLQRRGNHLALQLQRTAEILHRQMIGRAQPRLMKGQLLRLPKQIQNALVHILNSNRQLCLANREVQRARYIQFTQLN